MPKLGHSLRIFAHFARVHGHSPSLALELDPRSLERLTPANHGGSVLRLKSCKCTSWTFRDRFPEPPNTSCSPPFESATLCNPSRTIADRPMSRTQLY